MSVKTRVPRRRRQWPPNGETAAAVKAAIVRQTVGLREGGLRVKFERLDLGEQLELVDLVGKDDPSGKERRRLEELIEKGAAAPRVFESAREAATLAARTAELAAKARRPRRRPVLAQEGSVTLKREWVFDWLAQQPPVLLADHLAVLVFVASMFENGRALSPATSFDGDVLVVDSRLGLFGGNLDPEGRMVGWKDALKHLATNQFFEIEQRGPIWRVRPGARWLGLRKVA